MSVAMPSLGSGTVTSEYAATQSTTSRNVQNVNGEMVAVFSGNLNYSRIDYLVQGGKKTAIVTNQAANQPPMPGAPGGQNQDLFGSVYVSPEELAADLAADPALFAAFNTVADYQDAKIKADLVRRGILPTPVV